MPSDAMSVEHEEFLYKVYRPGGKITKVEKLRWGLFTKNKPSSSTLPAFPGATEFQHQIAQRNPSPRPSGYVWG